MALEILHSALVLLGRPARLEGAEIPAAAGLWVDFAVVEPVTARFELADHRHLPCGSGSQPERRCAAAIAMPTNRQLGSSVSAMALATNHNGESLSLLPTLSRQIGDVIFRLRKSKTKVSDELPIRRDLEDCSNGGGIKDRYPSHADAVGAGREPNRVDGCHRRILDHLGHGVTSEPVPLEGGAIGEYRELSGCFIQAGKLEPGIGCRSFLTLRRECVGVATLDICPNGCATDRIIDDDETPGFAQSNRGR